MNGNEIRLSDLIKVICKIIIIPDVRTFDLSQLHDSELTEISLDDGSENPVNTQ